MRVNPEVATAGAVRARLVRPQQLMRHGISAVHAPSSGHFSSLSAGAGLVPTTSRADWRAGGLSNFLSPPAQAGIHQGEGNDDALGFAATHRVVADGDGPLGVDGTADRCRHGHRRIGQRRGRFAGQQRLRCTVHTIALRAPVPAATPRPLNPTLRAPVPAVNLTDRSEPIDRSNGCLVRSRRPAAAGRDCKCAIASDNGHSTGPQQSGRFVGFRAHQPDRQHI